MEPSGGYEKELIYALQDAGLDVALFFRTSLRIG
jgi:transposase